MIPAGKCLDYPEHGQVSFQNFRALKFLRTLPLTSDTPIDCIYPCFKNYLHIYPLIYHYLSIYNPIQSILKN